MGVSRLDKVRIEEVRGRAGIEKELNESEKNRCFGHVGRMDEHRISIRMLMAEVRGVDGAYRVDRGFFRWRA